MPRAPSRPCTYPGCRAAAADRGRCATHARPSWEGRRGFEGYGGDYKRVRRQVLREERSCALCGGPAESVDHIVPVSRGGGHERENLRALCKPCHHARSEAQRRGKS